MFTEPDERRLAKIYSEMQPGSYIYTEWTANIFSKTQNYKSTLNKIGFEDINIFYPKPAPIYSVPRMYIALDSTGIVEYLTNTVNEQTKVNTFIKTLLSIRYGIWKRFPNLILRYPWLLSNGYYKFTLCSYARKPEQTSSNTKYYKTANKTSNTPISLIEKLIDGWGKWDIGEIPTQLSVLISCRGKSYYTKLILFIFADSDPYPTLLMKIPLSRDAKNDCLNEEYILNNLNKEHREIGRIPRLIFADNNSDSNLICQSYVKSIPLHFIANNNNLMELAILTTNWLIKLAKETKIYARTDWNNTSVKRIILELSSCMGSFLKPGTIEKTLKRLSEFELPFLICEHRDLNLTNVIINKGKIGVVDWENSRLNGIPGLDLIFFLTRICIHYVPEFNTDTFENKYKKMINPNTFIGTIFRDCTELYSSELNIPSSDIPTLRLLTWVFLTHMKFLDLTTGELIPQSSLSEGTIFAIRLWEIEAHYDLENIENSN